MRLVRAFERFTQRALARATGLSPTTIARAERGTARPRRSTLDRIASGVGLDLPDLERLLTLLRSAKTGGATPATDFVDSVSLSLALATGELALDPPGFAVPGAPLDFLLALPVEERGVWIERLAASERKSNVERVEYVLYGSISAPTSSSPRAVCEM